MEIEGCSKADENCRDEEHEDERAVSEILDRVAASDAFFKNQQRDEPDLTHDEKYRFAKECLVKSPSRFLSRFHKYLRRRDLKYFSRFGDDYDVNFYVREAEKRLSRRTKSKDTKNRRYEALQRLISEGNYFGDAEMQLRNPFVYEQMIGRYLTDDERQEIDSRRTNREQSLSSVLINQMLKNEMAQKYERQKCLDESITEEEEEDDEYEHDDDTGGISAPEKRMLREEFVSMMKQNFLDGNDVDFNYRDVDTNEEYDSISKRQQDGEDEYFDSEAPDG